MITQEKKKWIYQQLIPFIIVFGGFIFWIIFGQIWQYEFRTHGRYTIGTTTGTYWTLRAGEKVEYEFVLTFTSFKY
ncbi:hypothetical protein [Microbacter margulisiae]|uniref:Uncharacterized protein n=1 Tax=Microbacter margulisiae TaxID=1350067 RepID=A0A7W5DRR0_9PORP|nr:hypothetical protein [Microbacter margulisiae]MBB3187871.1 hypothetical protein [Microbacter margulisiae]